MVTPDLPPELDDDGVHLLEPFGALAVLDDVDHRRRNAFLQGFSLVRDPFELIVHLARRDQDGDLARARRDAGLEAEIAVERGELLAPLAVELNAGGACNPAMLAPGVMARS